MVPVNTKSMFALLCQTMDKVANNKIDVNKANTIGKLCGQANNLLNYELKRAIVLSNKDVKEEHRNIEGINFNYEKPKQLENE